MASYNKFEEFVGELGKGTHQLHAAGHTLKCYLTNNAPSASADAVKANLVGITEENGYAAEDAQNDYAEADGVGTLTCVDIVITATGDLEEFQYIVLYNDTPSDPADPLIAWWDYGSELTLQDGDSFTVDFGASIFTLA